MICLLALFCKIKVKFQYHRQLRFKFCTSRFFEKMITLIPSNIMKEKLPRFPGALMLKCAIISKRIIPVISDDDMI